MSQPESRLSRKIINALEAEGHFAFKVHGGASMMAGLPDIIVCVYGKFIGLEVKMPGMKKTTTQVQLLVHSKIRKAKGICEVVSSIDEALEVVRAYYP
jgi:Holliday junction resolvase